MSRIIRLPVDLANQIAAGEVVERPASVVKELIENSLDAKARRIGITVELGGKKSIRVEDDGEGMSPEDARLALERHATSKLKQPQDLNSITTLGFRGEALPSIASVSRMTLKTQLKGSDTGTEIHVDGNSVKSVTEISAASGTVIQVTDLFYNIPARRKFLKSDAAESAQISRFVTQLALGHPEVGFLLISAGRRVLQCPPVKMLNERFFQLYGEREDLIQVRKEAAGFRLYGYIAALTEHGPARGSQNIFVNRRIVKDRTISHAIRQAYSAATIKDRNPETHLFLDVAPDRIDVNVHPTKAEVRFLEQSVVHEVIRRALAEVLGQGQTKKFTFSTIKTTETGPIPKSLPGVISGSSLSDVAISSTRSFTPLDRSGGHNLDVEGSEYALGQDSSSGQVTAASDMDIRPMIPLGQFRDTFIIAVDDLGIAIVDQHVAHERVLFERVMERLTVGRLDSQRLLEPLLIDLSTGQCQALESHSTELQKFGFEVEEFGGKSLRISAVPAILSQSECSTAVRALADDLEGLDDGSKVEDALRKIAATTACHAAVKANDRLTMEKMRHILDELRQTAYSTVCPHGRPVVLSLTRREIEKKFLRI